MTNEDEINVYQLLSDTGINPFAAQLLAESYKNLCPEVKNVIPYPLVFNIKGVKITLQDSEYSNGPEPNPCQKCQKKDIVFQLANQ